MKIADNVQKTMDALKQNGMIPYYCEDEAEALDIVKSLIKPGDTVACGGSESIKEIGAVKLMRGSEYKFLDRSLIGLSPDEVGKLYREMFSADAFLCSANAITENGELFNVDGNCNRISAIAFGPKSVIVVAGVNKIVKDIPAAVVRLRTVAAPKNTKRLNRNTYCAKYGKCVVADSEKCRDIGAGCDSPDRICRTTLITSKQPDVGRIKVIIVNKELGY